MIILKKINIKNKIDYEKFVNEWLSIELHQSIIMNEEHLPFKNFLKLIDTLEKNKSNPMNYYLVYHSTKIIGYLEIRTSNNEFNSKYAGNIGFAVSPIFRNQGYGLQILKKGVQILKNSKHSPIYLTCDMDQHISKHLFEKINASYLKTEQYLQEKKEIYIIK